MWKFSVLSVGESGQEYREPVRCLETKISEIFKCPDNIPASSCEVCKYPVRQTPSTVASSGRLQAHRTICGYFAFPRLELIEKIRSQSGWLKSATGIRLIHLVATPGGWFEWKESSNHLQISGKMVIGKRRMARKERKMAFRRFPRD